MLNSQGIIFIDYLESGQIITEAYPPYSPDLAPCNIFLFPNLKIWLRGKRFHSNKEAIIAVDEYFEGLEICYFTLVGLAQVEYIETPWTL